jgi:hypothetical protein
MYRSTPAKKELRDMFYTRIEVHGETLSVPKKAASPCQRYVGRKNHVRPRVKVARGATALQGSHFYMCVQYAYTRLPKILSAKGIRGQPQKNIDHTNSIWSDTVLMARRTMSLIQNAQQTT